MLLNQFYAVMTEHIVDVREGQNSCGFDRYPYDELEDQSLSILVEGEKQSKLIIKSNPISGNTLMLAPAWYIFEISYHHLLFMLDHICLGDI